MRNFISVFIFLFPLFLLAQSSEQHSINEGKATFSFSYPDENRVDAKTLAQREIKSLTVYFKSGKSRAVYDQENHSYVYLIDPGKKESILLKDSTAFVHTFDDLKASLKKIYGDTMAVITKETKTIAGYTCTKAIYCYAVADDKPIRKFIIWFTRDIAASNPNFDFKGIDGFIMEYDLLDILYPNGEPVNFTEIMTCTSVEKQKIPSSFFDVPKNFQKINWSDMIKNAKVEYEEK